MGRVCLPVVFLVLLLFSSVAAAQTANTGVVTVTVKDSSGRFIPGAQIELLKTGTNQVRRRFTNHSGRYTFTAVSPGDYGVTVTMTGFRTALVSTAKVDVARSLSIAVTLEVGGIDERVEVVAQAEAELQRFDSTIGSVTGRENLMFLPSLQRNAAEFLTLQPATIPEAGDGDSGDRGGAVAGARSDQSTFTLDGIDITENINAGGATFRTIVPIPVDSVEEFRVGVTNPNATFGRSAGAQVSLVGRRGSNEFHGSAYWYHQNDNLNASSWTNNRNGVPEAELKDNRYGFRIGGPLFRDETFFFFNYEGRNFPRSFDTLRIVPTESLRRGVLRFRDASGGVVDYHLGSSSLCGPESNQPCDPRALGLSPSIQALWALTPPGNDPSSGDGLNTIGFRSTAAAPQETDYSVFRFDHDFSDLWRFDGSGTYWRNLRIGPSSSPIREQLDIRGGDAVFPGVRPQRGQNITLGLTGSPTSDLTNSLRFGWTRDRTGTAVLPPSDAATLLAIPGTETGAGHVALNVGGRGSLDSLVSEPIDVGAQRARTQSNDNQIFQYVDDVSWMRGNHSFQFGANIRHIVNRHSRNDKVVGSLSSLVASVDDGSFISIPDSSRPPTCAGPSQRNCLEANDVGNWNRFFSGATGMVDNLSVLVARDGNLAPLPLGTPLISDTTQNSYEFYFQDSWQLSPSLTLNLGLSYGWLTPPDELLGRQTLMINNETGDALTFDNYIGRRHRAGLQGEVFNPEIAFLPIDSSSRNGIFNADRNNWGPRLAVAWNPGAGDGFWGKLLGDRKTVLRGGFGIVYDRINLVQSVVIPLLGVGFGQTVNVSGPSCDASASGGMGCNPGGGDPESAFRVGVDGPLPLPNVGPAESPVVPPPVLSELLSFQMDPDFDVARNYVYDFTIQRELGSDLILELGYVGRSARDLPTSVNFNSAPFFQIDPASGQSFCPGV